MKSMIKNRLLLVTAIGYKYIFGSNVRLKKERRRRGFLLRRDNR